MAKQLWKFSLAKGINAVLQFYEQVQTKILHKVPLSNPEQCFSLTSFFFLGVLSSVSLSVSTVRPNNNCYHNLIIFQKQRYSILHTNKKNILAHTDRLQRTSHFCNLALCITRAKYTIVQRQFHVRCSVNTNFVYKQRHIYIDRQICTFLEPKISSSSSSRSPKLRLFAKTALKRKKK